jgi:DNA-binding MarR family transcriptional regulator
MTMFMPDECFPSYRIVQMEARPGPRFVKWNRDGLRCVDRIDRQRDFDCGRLHEILARGICEVISIGWDVHIVNIVLDVHAMNALHNAAVGGVSMDRTLLRDSGEDERIVLNLLNSVDDGAQSQRRIAEELGIALGLVNAYLKRCIKKGLVKVSQAPARRYAYYLTPQGFAEKSRLTVEYLSYSFSFFRQAKADCAQVFQLAKQQNLQNLVLSGKSDLAEIAILSAVDCGISIAAIVDPNAGEMLFAGKPVVSDYSALTVPFDAVIVTDLVNGHRAFDEAVRLYGAGRVLAPKLLGLNVAERREAGQ